MHNQAFAALEYDELRNLVRRGAQTPMGRARADELAPLSDLIDIRRAQRAVSEYLDLRRQSGAWSFSEVADPAEALALLRIEAAPLDSFKLLELARLCEQASQARQSIQVARDQCPVLWEVVAGLSHELTLLASRVTAKILPSGELDDRASPELARTRAEITRLRSDIARTLERLMRRSEEAVQDQLVTVRNDRFVIPIRSDHRGRVAGVAHGSSSSGATVFIEPLETIEANNDLQALREREEREVRQILAALTEELRRESPAIEEATRAVTELDFIRAKAVLSERLNCVEPVMDEHGLLELVEARHPLLEENLRQAGGAVVPISFTLDSSHPIMVISGANAGGKTVVLKTAGLLALMALSGLHVPARRASIPFYASILADIGDRQSLQANLSTFTSHISNIRLMIESCRPPALVLLDEVGTGTDPEEGSALGVAVVDYFRRQCGAEVIATTHYSGLKMYAASDEGVINASVEFDEKTLQPTYRLLVGLAGASSGLEIARRFGLPERIVHEAEAGVKESAREAAEYLRRIKREAEAAENLRQAVEEERQAVAEEYASLSAEAQKRERAREAEFARELREQIEEFERRSQELLSKIEDRAVRLRVEREAERRTIELRREAERATRDRTAQKPTNEPTAGVRIVRRNKDAEAYRAFDDRTVSPAATERREIVAGDHVRLSALGTTGIVERLNDGEAEVLVGSMRFREKTDNLELLESAPEKEEKGRGARLQRMASQGTEIRLRHSDEAASTELNLIGRTTDEATDAADKFLDEAYLHSLGRVRIIHGHGTGALRRAIADLLRTHPHVESFTQAPPEQGGAGATLVELRQ